MREYNIHDLEAIKSDHRLLIYIFFLTSPAVDQGSDI